MEFKTLWQVGKNGAGRGVELESGVDKLLGRRGLPPAFLYGLSCTGTTGILGIL